MPNSPAQEKNTIISPQNNVELGVTKAAKLLNVSPSTLRRLEEAGRIASIRTENGYRVFKLQDVLNLKNTLESETVLTKPETFQAPVTKPQAVQQSKLQKDSTVNLLKGINTFSKVFKLSTLAISLLLILTAAYTNKDNLNKEYLTAAIQEIHKSITTAIKTAQDIQRVQTAPKIAGNVLAARTRNPNLELAINIPTNLGSTVTINDGLTVTGLATLSGGITTGSITLTGIGTMSNLQALDTVSKATFEETLELDGDVSGTLDDTTVDSLGGATVGDITGGTLLILDGDEIVGGDITDLDTTDITELGTITTGVWNGTTLATTYGGTGLTSYTTGDMIYASAANTLLQLNIGTAGQMLTVSALGTPQWESVSGALGGNVFLTGGNSFGANAILGTNDAYSLSFETNDVTRMTITSAGNVGIGNTNPQATLDIAGDVILGADSGDTTTFNARILSGSSILPAVDLGSDLGSDSYRFNNLYVANINSNAQSSFTGQVMFTYEPLNTNYTQASVMINPTSPIANGYLLGIGAGGYQRFGVDAEGDVSIGYNSATSIPSTSNPLMVYGHNNTGIFTVTSGGNVGIGTSSPNARLNVVGGNILVESQATSATTRFVSTNSTTGAYVGVLNSGASTNMYLWQNDNGGMRFGTNNTERMLIDASGNITLGGTTAGSGQIIMNTTNNVGIGTTNPGAKLDIATGNIDLDNTTNANQYGVISKAGTRFIHDFNYGNNGTVTTSGGNIFVGVESGNLTMGSTATQIYHASNNTAVGYQALDAVTTGWNNSAFGANALTGLTSAPATTAFGNLAGAEISEGGYNTIMGSSAMRYGNGSSNTIIGNAAGYGVTGNLASRNTFIGYNSGYSIATNGSDNIFLGYKAADNATSGHTNIVIGYDIDLPTATTNNMLNIGNLIFANGIDGTGTTLSSGNVGIGFTSPSTKLHILDTSTQMRLGYDTSNYFDFGVQSDGSLFMGQDGSNQQFSFKDGNVSIGTTDPMAKLHIKGVARLEDPTDTTLRDYQFSVNTDGSLSLGDSVSGERMRISSGGYVGIGNTNPARNLHIYDSTTNSTFLQLSHSSAGTSATDGVLLGSSSSNLFLYNYENGYLRIMNNSKDVFYANSSGNVGIGTTGPTTKLDVLGTGTQLRLAYDLSNYFDFGVQSDGALFMGQDGSNQQFSFKDGNVGIGTTNPLAKLEIARSAGAALRFTDTTYGDMATLSSATGRSLFRLYGQDWGEAVRLYTYGDSWIGNSFNQGNLGIGKSIPQAKLDVAGGTRWSYLGGAAYYLDLSTVVTPSNVRYAFALTNAGTNYPNMLVFEKGNIGIGTTSPERNLHIKSVATHAYVELDAPTAGTAGILLAKDGTVSWQIIQPGNSTDLRFFNGGSYKMTIKNDGNVGIGTTDPGLALDVVGNARFSAVGSGTLNADIGITADGTLTTDASDISLKTNLSPVENALSKILNLQGYYFNWTNDPNGSRKVGMVAQQVAQFIPEVTFTNPTDGLMGINYSKLTSVLVEGMKEQQAQIDNLATIDGTISKSLLQDVEDIKARLDILENIPETSESTDSGGTGPLQWTPTGILSAVENIFQEFKDLLAALGLSQKDDTLVVSTNLAVLGDTTLSNLTITGNLIAGMIKIDTLENSIGIQGPPCTQDQDNILCEAQTLYIQKDRPGNVDILDQAMLITPDGNVTVKGTVKAAAIEVTEEGATIGTATLSATTTEVTVETSKITEISKIFVTATSNTQGQSLFVVEKTEKESFTVGISKALDTDIEFNWWIVN